MQRFARLVPRVRPVGDRRPAHTILVILGIACLAGVGGCASSADLSDAEMHQSGRIIVAGQVTPAQINDLHTQGVQAVINCRTPSEMDTLSFDEPGMLDELGMAYTHVPLGGSDGYTPEAVEAFAEAMQAHDGDVLIHCKSGGRARTLYAAYLIRYEGLSADEARERIQKLGAGPSSLERLLGEQLRYELTGEPLSPEEPDDDS